MVTSEPADGSTVDTIQGSGAPANMLVTVTSTLGTILTDDSPGYAGAQVQADGTGTFFFQLRRPAGAGIPTFTAQSVNGQENGSGTAAGPSGTLEYTFAGLQFDLNGSASGSTQSGYLGVAPGVSYTSALGYGWVSPDIGLRPGCVGRHDAQQPAAGRSLGGSQPLGAARSRWTVWRRARRTR